MTPLLVVLLASEPATSSSPASMVDPRHINVACDSAEKYAGRHESEGRMVADVSDAVRPKKGEGTWKVFKTPKDMESAGSEGAPNSQARVWVAPGAVTFVDAIFQSDSGDWAHFVAYCYRGDGTLARSISTYNTFLSDSEDGVTRVRTRYYDQDGKILRTKEKVLNLRTRKAFPNAKFGDVQEQPFLKLADLPFWDIVKDGLTDR